MPRGDGRKIQESRPLRKRLNLPQYIPKGLATRIDWWENQFAATAYRPKDKHDGKGNSYRRPGSQKR